MFPGAWRLGYNTIPTHWTHNGLGSKGAAERLAQLGLGAKGCAQTRKLAPTLAKARGRRELATGADKATR